MATLAKQLKYTFYLMFHPFDGFWDLKHEKRGGKNAAYVILGLMIITSIIQSQYTGFLYNPSYDGVSLNLITVIGSVLGTFFLWCLANWALTTLMDGEGSFGDIFLASAYALAPLILINIPVTFLSNIMPLELGAFFTLAKGVAVVWTGLLMLSGLMVVHQYGFIKTLGSALLIVVGMAVIIFLALLFFNLVSQLMGFGIELYWEITMRFF